MRVVMTMLLVVLALQIAGCGKRARYLDPPDPDAGQYPKHYPPPDPPGTHL